MLKNAFEKFLSDKFKMTLAQLGSLLGVSDSAADGVGTTWHVESDAPDNGVGINGDFLVVSGTGNVYSKAGGVYSLAGNMAFPATASYSVYSAIVNQQGADDPIATVLETTLGTPVTFERQSTGSYALNPAVPFVQAKTLVFIGVTPTGAVHASYDPISGIMMLVSESEPGTSADDIIAAMAIRIEVYP